MADRDVICGMQGDIHWQPVLPAEGLGGLEAQGKWTRQGDLLICEEKKGAASLSFGAPDWENYELAVCVKSIAGGNVQVMFRASPEGNYLLDLLMGWQAIAVSKVDRRPGGRGFHKASVVNHVLERGRAYEVQLAARDASITTYVDGQLINQLTDYDFPRGRAALCVWQGKTEFHAPRYRLL